MKKKEMNAKTRKMVFYGILLVSYILILFYNVVTPWMSDELQVVNTKYASFLEIIKAEWRNYQTWNGRFVVQLIMRVFLMFPKWIFNILNSLCFVYLSLLIYWNLDNHKKYDFVMLIYSTVFMWLFSVDFGQTVLWESGACNYLWGSAIIMSMVTLYRYKTRNTATIKSPGLFAIGMFFLGLIAGWCNENTSGGGFLIILFTFLMYHKNHRKEKVRVWMVTGLLGMLTGIIFMVAAPGNRARANALKESGEETHTGVMKYVARFLKINQAIEDYFFILLVIVIVIGVYLLIKGHQLKEMETMLLFSVVCLLTSFALFFTVPPMNRAYYGAGIYIIVAALQAITYLRGEDTLLYHLKYSFLIILCVHFYFVYVENGANLTRIYLAVEERDQDVREQIAQGNMDIEMTQICPMFDNPYTFFYRNDVDEDPNGWGCSIYRDYYGVNSVVGIPYEFEEGYQEY